MINNDGLDRLSRSVSHQDHTEKSSSSASSLAYIVRDQSSCSSLTSGIGQSDQSISTTTERIIKSDQDVATNPTTTGNEQTTRPNLTAQTNKPNTTSIDAGSSDSDQFTTIDLKVDNVNVEQQQQQKQCDAPEKELDDDTRLKLDIKKFVDIIFTDSQSISLEKKAEFGKLMRTQEARLLFAKSVDDYRVNSKRVSELTFYSLAQYFSIVLLECLLAEDFRPAKIIMNMMFTYYYEQNFDKIPPRDRITVQAEQHHHIVTDPFNIDSDDDEDGDGNHVPRSKTVKTYLYTLLKDQEIFKSIRFWTSAFYETVIIERNNHPVFIDKQRGKLSNEKRDEELDCSKNITFGLLGSFIHNMCLLDLSHEFCQEFLDKHSTIADLSDHQLEMLRSNLESMFKDTSGSAPISQATASERLSMFLQKCGIKSYARQIARSAQCAESQGVQAKSAL